MSTRGMYQVSSTNNGLLRGTWGEAAVVSTSAAPVQLEPEDIALRMEGGVSSRDGPSQLKPGRQTAEHVYPAHSSSRRTLRRRIERQTWT